MRKVISASLSPNTSSQDVMTALRVFFMPWVWRVGVASRDVVDWFKVHYNADDVFLYQSGRTALYEILRAYGIGTKDEVILQAFTCVAVANSIRWTGATPIYGDIDASLNLDPTDIAKKITPRTKAIIVQHTFGVPADMDAITGIAKKHNCIVIEDCAHAIGATHHNMPVGDLADAAFFSFGRDKAVSSVWGGAALIHATPKNKEVLLRLQKQYASLTQPSLFWVAGQIFHPIAFSVILPTYTMGLGKVVLVLFQKLGVLSKPVAREELAGNAPTHMRSRYPNALAELLMVQLHKLDHMVTRRRKSAATYAEKLPKRFRRIPAGDGTSYVRYPVFVDDPQSYIRSAKFRGILLGNWYHNIIDPVGTDFAAIGYRNGSCPNAEYAASHILNFPTTISSADCAAVLDSVK